MLPEDDGPVKVRAFTALDGPFSSSRGEARTGRGSARTRSWRARLPAARHRTGHRRRAARLVLDRRPHRPHAGALADRHDRRLLLVLADALLMMLPIAPGLSGLMLAALLLSATEALVSPARTSWVADLVVDKRLPTANARLYADASTGYALGPLVARVRCAHLGVLRGRGCPSGRARRSSRRARPDGLCASGLAA